jgi:hypothetical protein
MEYPKMLYMGGDISAAYVVVDDEAQEAAAKNDGYLRLWSGDVKAPAKPWIHEEAEEPAKRGPGRPKKDAA